MLKKTYFYTEISF